MKTPKTFDGKLRHASIILPATWSFFTPINAAMSGGGKKIGLGWSSDIRVALHDLCCLLRLLSAQPTHVRKLVIDMPCYVGYHDAAAEGEGGV
jgi:hypothetical protein